LNQHSDILINAIALAHRPPSEGHDPNQIALRVGSIRVQTRK